QQLLRLGIAEDGRTLVLLRQRGRRRDGERDRRHQRGQFQRFLAEGGAEQHERSFGDGGGRVCRKRVRLLIRSETGHSLLFRRASSREPGITSPENAITSHRIRLVWGGSRFGTRIQTRRRK